jgi:hypothetical protein
MERCPLCRAMLNGAETCRTCRAELHRSKRKGFGIERRVLYWDISINPTPPLTRSR